MVVWLHAIGLIAASMLLVDRHGVIEGVAGGLLMGFLAILADRPRFNRRLRSSLTSLALLSASAFLVHLSGGYIEMHFHFFVALGIIALYQDWVPFLVAIGFVLIEHGVSGCPVSPAPSTITRRPGSTPSLGRDPRRCSSQGPASPTCWPGA